MTGWDFIAGVGYLINDLLVLFSVVGASVLFLAEIINRRFGRRLLKVGDPIFPWASWGSCLV